MLANLPSVFLKLAEALCEVLADLGANGLSHNDLHGENILISPRRNPLTGDISVELIVIDTGSLKTEERRLDLLEQWGQDREVLVRTSTENSVDLNVPIAKLDAWV